MHKVISLVAKASSALKTEGWSRFVEAAKERGPLVVTHRNRPEAVVLSTAEFDRLMLIAEQEDARRAKVLSDLSASFDQRLAGLKAPGAAEALDRVMTEPLDLQGKLRAGQGF
jgi:prevent-host-death family protein